MAFIDPIPPLVLAPRKTKRGETPDPETVRITTREYHPDFNIQPFTFEKYAETL